MNENLQKLVKQATHSVLGVQQLDSIMLAESIVRECMSLCDDYNSQKYIANHFGLTPLELSEMENRNV